MITQNKRKKDGAIVWHEMQLKRITNQNVGKEFIVLENLVKVKRGDVKLAKKGDAVKFKDLAVLPERCSKMGVMRITGFLENGIVFTDKDTSGSGYGHFEAAN
jgi:hypothetical protein